MEKCIKCGGTLPAGAKLCPYCGNPVSYYEEKMQPVPPAPTKKTRGRTILIVAVSVLSVLLIASLAFALMLWTTSTGAPPKLGVSPGSLDFGTLQVGSQSSQVLTLSNSGKQDLNWNADKGAANWLTLDPSQGRIPSAGSQTIYVRADTTQLTAGRYSASISFTSNGGGASVSAVLIVATGQPSQGAPVVSGISPTSGPAVGGTTVTIRGSGFTGASQVLFGTATSTFTVNSDTQITVVSPAGSGTVHVTVITPKGASVSSSADQFTYQGAQLIPPIPTIASISPTSGPTTGGMRVTITGTGFTGVSKVLFGATAASFTVNTDKQITAVSPAGSGTVDVRVITPGGTSNAARFNYYVPGPPPAHVPFIKSISPPSGPVAGGTTVTITGSGFTGASKVLFGSVPASFKLTSDMQITAVSPAGSGTVDVKVTTPGGTSATSSADRFTYVPAPIVTAVSPTSGPAAGGTSVIITGSNFTGASKVLFGTVAANFTLNSNTQITAISPAGSGTVDVKVITPGGTSKTSNADKFTYLQSAQIAVAPSSLDFGKMDPNTTKPLPVTVKNTGGQPLKWNVAVQPVGTTWLKVDKNHDTVQPGGQQAIKVTADTKNLTAGQKYDAILIFTSNGGDKQVSAKLTVTVPPSAPAVSLSPTSLSFGDQQVGTTSAEKTVTLTNSGTASLTINSIDIGGTNKGDFAQTRLIPNSLAPGASCTIGVTFTPSDTGSRDASLTISDNASDSPQSVTLSGSGS